jgi:biotin carboxyl carrier protein
MATQILSEMTASVWKVEVHEGDAVADGATLVILESMKMEIPVVTEIPGTVRALHVGAGDTVKEGDLIAVLD